MATSTPSPKKTARTAKPRTYWLTALLVVASVFALDALGMFRWVERVGYDAGVRFSATPAPDQISVIAIDEPSIANIGRWPWARNRCAV